MSEEKSKLVKLRELINDIKLTSTFKDNGDYIELELTLDGHCIKAYERNRKSFGGHMYDPLATYKKEIKKILDPEVKKYIENPLKGYCEVNMEVYFRMPKDFSKKKVAAGLNKTLRPTLKKNDNDNVEKTTFDLFNNLVYADDGQIIDNHTKKYYDIQEKIIIAFKIYKEELIIKGR